MVEPLLEATTSVKVVKADGAYDRRCVRRAVQTKGASLLTPPPKNARVRGIDQQRDSAVLSIRGLGGDLCAKSLWGRLTGYSYKSVSGNSFFSL